MLHVGHRNYVDVSKILAITGIDSAPLFRLKKHAAECHKLIDCTAGRAANSLIHLVDGYIVLSSSSPDTLRGRNKKDLGE